MSRGTRSTGAGTRYEPEQLQHDITHYKSFRNDSYNTGSVFALLARRMLERALIGSARGGGAKALCSNLAHDNVASKIHDIL